MSLIRILKKNNIAFNKKRYRYKFIYLLIYFFSLFKKKTFVAITNVFVNNNIFVNYIKRLNNLDDKTILTIYSFFDTNNANNSKFVQIWNALLSFLKAKDENIFVCAKDLDDEKNKYSDNVSIMVKNMHLLNTLLINILDKKDIIEYINKINSI